MTGTPDLSLQPKKVYQVWTGGTKDEFVEWLTVTEELDKWKEPVTVTAYRFDTNNLIFPPGMTVTERDEGFEIYLDQVKRSKSFLDRF